MSSELSKVGFEKLETFTFLLLDIKKKTFILIYHIFKYSLNVAASELIGVSRRQSTVGVEGILWNETRINCLLLLNLNSIIRISILLLKKLFIPRNKTHFRFSVDEFAWNSKLVNEQSKIFSG